MTLHKNYPFPVYSDSTLKGMTKEMLIGEIRCLEYNLAGAYQMNDVQARYIDFFCKTVLMNFWRSLFKRVENMSNPKMVC